MPTSVRGLQDSGVGPLRKFYGNLIEIEEKEEKGNNGTYTRVFFRFNELEVIQSTEPYPYPIAEVNITYNPKKQSRWGFFGTSITKFLTETEDYKDTIKRRQGWVYCDGLDGRPKPHKTWDRRADDGKGAEVDTPAWEVFDIVGAAGSATASESVEHMKQLLDGKSVAEFNKVAFADPVLKAPGSVDLQRSIMDKSFVNTLLQLGEFTVDENSIYHRAKK